MYLSQLILDPRARVVLENLADPYQLHRTVMSGFSQELPTNERVLYRLDMQRSEPQLSILVQSHTLPNWDILSQRGYLLRPAVIKTLTFQPTAGQVFWFRLAANPTKRLRAEGKNDGARIGLVREEDQLTWLNRKGEQHGFQVLATQTTKIVQADGWKFEKGQNHRIRQHAVRFDGRLQVTDVETFTRALENGIGSGKGFGFGLLSLAPVD